MFSNISRKLLPVIIGIVCSSSYGIELPDLIAKLKKLDGRDSLQVSVHITDNTKGQKDKKSQQFESDFKVQSDANNITVTYQGDISKMAAGAAAQNLSTYDQASNSKILQEFSLLRAGEIINCGPILSEGLKDMKLIDSRTEQLDGQSCTMLHLKSEQKHSQSGANVTIKLDTQLWIDGDGYPIAATFKTQANISMLLVFKFSSESERRQRFKRVGNRLILTLDKNEMDVKTDEGNTKRTVTTTVQPPQQ
jgi:hypothetical protein